MEIPLQSVEKTMVKQVVVLQPMAYPGRADLHPAACGGPHATAGGCTLKEAVACGEPTLEQVLLGDIQGRRVRWKENQRPQPLFSIPQHCSESGVRLSLGG